MEFKELIKQQRILRNLSLQQAATLLGITKPHLFDLEKGKSENPTVKVVNSIREHYELDAETLLNSFFS